MRAPDHAPGEARAFCHSIFVELDEHRMRQPIDSRIKTAYAVTEALRQHRNYSVWQINTVTAPARFAIEGTVRFNVSGDISNVHPESPTGIVDLFDVNRVVEIACIVRIDGDDKFLPQIFTSLEFPCIDGFGNPICLINNVSRKFGRQMIFPNDRQHIHARRRGGPEYLDDVAFWINVARLPRLESNDNFVTDCSDGLRPPIFYRPDIYIVDDSWIVWNDVIEITGMLQRADDCIVRALQNPNYAAFLSSFGAGVGLIASDAHNDAIAVHRCAGIFGCDKNIRLARFFGD